MVDLATFRNNDRLRWTGGHVFGNRDGVTARVGNPAFNPTATCG